MKQASGLACLTGALLMASCQTSRLDPVPKISNLVLTPDSINVMVADTAFIQVDFEDGDGDIGTQSFFIRNTRRASPVEKFDISPDLDQYIDPQLGVRGSSLIILPSNFPFFEIADTSIKRDTAILEVYMQDAAGHKSNVLKTRPLILRNDSL